jgi:hypothetical protein
MSSPALVGLLACLAVLAASPAFAQASSEASLPAVSEINGKVSLEGGTVGAQGRSSALGAAQGSIAAPLGHSFGLQFDGAASTAFNSFGGGGAAHLFWRNPAIGLLGPVVALSGSRGNTTAQYAGEADLYAGPVTISAFGGYQDAGALPGSSGGFYQGRLTLYPIPDLALMVGGGQFIGRTHGVGRIEYQPEFLARRNLSFFVNGGAGENSFYRVTGGVRLYFGPVKSLIRRHREDDPHYTTFDATPSNGGNGGLLFGNGGNGGAGGSGGLLIGNGGSGGNGS